MEIEDLKRDSARLSWLIEEALAGRQHLDATIKREYARQYIDLKIATANIQADVERARGGEMITRLSQLMIIGYAGRRGPDDLPDSVLPVFAVDNCTAALLPPFRVDRDRVIGGRKMTLAECLRLNDDGDITLFGVSFPPLIGHSLVIVAGGGHYVSTETAIRIMERSFARVNDNLEEIEGIQ